MSNNFAVYVITIAILGCVVSVFVETGLLRAISTKREMSIGDASLFPASQTRQALVRVYPTWYNYSYCSPSERHDPMNSYAQKQPIRSGFLFVKNEKSASSTCAAVHSRIAKQVGRRVLSTKFETNNETVGKRPICENRGETHLWSTRLQRRSRCNPHFKCLKGRRRHTFLWTMIRDADAQKISLYYHFFVSKGSANATSKDDFNEYLNKTRAGEFYYRKLVASWYNETRMATDDVYVEREANRTLHNFDFIGIAERIEESFAVLGLLLQVPPSDLIYLSPSKLSGSYIHSSRRKSCYLLHKAEATDYMKNYLNSDEWKRKNRFNLALYKAANASLDSTIDSFGQDVFDKYLTQYRTEKASAARICKASSPCGPNGEVLGHGKHCSNGDMGCDDACLDKLFANVTFQ